MVARFFHDFVSSNVPFVGLFDKPFQTLHLFLFTSLKQNQIKNILTFLHFLYHINHILLYNTQIFHNTITYQTCPYLKLITPYFQRRLLPRARVRVNHINNIYTYIWLNDFFNCQNLIYIYTTMFFLNHLNNSLITFRVTYKIMLRKILLATEIIHIG